MINDNKFRQNYNITSMELFRATDLFRIRFGPIYLGFNEHNPNSARQLRDSGEEKDLLSREPIAVAYKDGGIEYLAQVIGQSTEHPAYQCSLYMPSTRMILTYYHPIENRDLIERLRQK